MRQLTICVAALLALVGPVAIVATPAVVQPRLVVRDLTVAGEEGAGMMLAVEGWEAVADQPLSLQVRRYGRVMLAIPAWVESGMVVTETAHQPLGLLCRWIGPGEVIELGLGIAGADRDIATATTVPNPLEVRSNLYPIEVTPLDGYGQTWKLHFAGFEALELVKINSQSGPETMPTSWCCLDKNGSQASVVAPAVVGMDGGVCHFSVEGNLGTWEVDLPWGTAYEKQTVYDGDDLSQPAVRSFAVDPADIAIRLVPVGDKPAPIVWGPRPSDRSD